MPKAARFFPVSITEAMALELPRFRRTGILSPALKGAGAIRIWNIEIGTRVRTINGHTDSVEFAAFSPDGKRIAFKPQVYMQIWDIETGTFLKRTFKGHFHQICSVFAGRRKICNFSRSTLLRRPCRGYQIFGAPNQTRYSTRSKGIRNRSYRWSFHRTASASLALAWTRRFAYGTQTQAACSTRSKGIRNQ